MPDTARILTLPAARARVVRAAFAMVARRPSVPEAWSELQAAVHDWGKFEQEEREEHENQLPADREVATGIDEVSEAVAVQGELHEHDEVAGA